MSGKMDRRSFVKAGAALGAMAAFPVIGCNSSKAGEGDLPKYSGAAIKGSDKIKVGLIGCGGRGTGAATNAMNGCNNVELVAVADLFQDKLDSVESRLKSQLKGQEKFGFGGKESQINIQHKFCGFDAYKKLCETDVDVVIDACPPAFRTPHAEAIVNAGKHAFLEKPACIDITQMRKMREISALADKKGLSIMVGTQRHYNRGYQEAIERVKNGDIGEIVAAQCYWNSAGYVGHSQHDAMEKQGLLKGLSPDDMEYQIRNWFSFIWASGDHIVEQHVHNIDVVLWAMGYKLPVEVNGMGGRSTDLPVMTYGDRFSHFAIDYDMGDGVHIASYCRQDPNTAGHVMERVIGTKGIMETHEWGKQRITGAKAWESPYKNTPPSVIMEHKALYDALKEGKRINALPDLITSTGVGIAGRMSAFSGKRFKYGWMVEKSQEDLMPKQMAFVKNPLPGVPVPGKYQLV